MLAANREESDAVLRDARSTGSVRDRLHRAIAGWYTFTLDAPGVPAFLTEAWAAAAWKPLIADLVARRRERAVTVATVILREGATSGELAADLDVDTTARAIAALLDGIVLESVGPGPRPSRTDVERRVSLLLGSTVAPGAGKPRPRAARRIGS